MYKKKYQLLTHILFLILISNFAYGQQRTVKLAIDSYYSDEEDITKEKNYSARNFEEVYPYDPNGFLARGIEKMKAGFYQEAHSDITESIDLAPDCGICHYFRGNNYIQMDSLGQAKNDFKKAVKFDPLLIEGYNDLARVYIFEDNLDSARVVLQDGIDYYPAFPYTYFNLGMVETMKNKPAKAIKHFKKCLELEPCYQDAYSYIVSIHLYKNNLKKAESTLNAALACNPETSEFYLWKSIIKLLKSKHKEAITEISKAIKVEPLYNYFYYRGMLQVYLKEYTTAIVDFDKAFEINPLDSKDYKGDYSYKLIQKDFQEPVTYFLANKDRYSEDKIEKIEKGLGLLFLERYVDASRIFKKMEKQKKADEFVYWLLGITKEQQYDKVEALSYYNKSIAINNTLLETHKRRGLIYQYRGALEDAIQDFSKMYEIDPSSSEALKYNALAKIINGDYENGLKDLKIYEEKFEADTDVLFNIGQCQTYLGKLEEGIKYYEKALKDDPGDLEIIYKIAENNYSLGRSNESFSLCDSLLKIRECYTMAINLQGVIYMDSLKNDKAIEYFTKAIECSSIFVDAYINRGLMYFKIGENANALFDINQALKKGSRSNLAYLLRAHIKYKLKDETACSDLETAIKLGSQVSEADRNAICQ